MVKTAVLISICEFKSMNHSFVTVLLSKYSKFISLIEFYSIKLINCTKNNY